MRHPLNTPIGRFGIETDLEAPGCCLATMPVHGLLNPITGTPSLGPLAVLVDHAAGLVNHDRRGADEWTVTSELSLELAPTCAAVIAGQPDLPVVASARFVGSKSTTGLGECDLTVGGELVGTGTVRSYFIQAPGQLAEWSTPNGAAEAKIGLAAMMAVGDPHRDGDTHVLPQGADRADDRLATASLRVNFLRQFFAGGQSRYVGTALRVGRRSAVADSQAVGSDGKVAIIARLTAYRC